MGPLRGQDLGTQDYSAIGPGAQGWPARPVFRLLQLFTTATEPRGRIVQVVPAPGVPVSKALTGYISPAGDITILGLETRGGMVRHDLGRARPVHGWRAATEHVLPTLAVECGGDR